MKKIMIVAGEASGDMHGAGLVTSMNELDCDLSFCGVGDKALREAGVDIIFESREISVVGLFEVLYHLRHIRSAFKKLVQRLKTDAPSLLILIDFPDFNLLLAKQARKLGIPVFYYISPQVWAWRSGRVKKIAKLVNKLAVILPFEKKFYEDHGVKNVEFVGHPLVDSVQVSDSSKSFRAAHTISENSVIVGMLPGSRRKEISSILPEFIQTAKKIIQQYKEVSFVLPLAHTLSESDLKLSSQLRSEINLKVISGKRYDLMANCDLVMVASGTVTLELALLNIPMVVVYKIAPLTHFMAKLLIKIEFASLVNLIAGKEVVRELLQSNFNADNLFEALLEIWPGTPGHLKLKTELEKIRTMVGPSGASKRAGEIALTLVDERY